MTTEAETCAKIAVLKTEFVINLLKNNI